MLEALIFDFDGVVVDSEPIHYEGFRRVLGEQFGLELDRGDYYERYLAFTDRDAFALILAENGRESGEQTIHKLTAIKTRYVQEALKRAEPLPGVVELMREAREQELAVAICSGALRAEVELPLAAIGADNYVQLIVSAENVRVGKPDPSGYQLTRTLLAGQLGRDLPPQSCVAIEDAPAGIAAARGAGLHVLGVGTSVDLTHLKDADRAVESLSEITLSDLRFLSE